MQLKNNYLPARKCPVCNGQVHGRTDKIYCTVQCKNHHHAYARRQNKPLTLEVNRRLGRNLTILQGLAGPSQKRMSIHRAELSRRGFDFAYCTSSQRNNRKKTVYGCYHFSYRVDDHGIVHIEQHAEISPALPGFFRRWETEFPKGMEVGGDITGTDPLFNRRE